MYFITWENWNKGDRECHPTKSVKSMVLRIKNSQEKGDKFPYRRIIESRRKIGMWYEWYADTDWKRIELVTNFGREGDVFGTLGLEPVTLQVCLWHLLDTTHERILRTFWQVSTVRRRRWKFNQVEFGAFREAAPVSRRQEGFLPRHTRKRRREWQSLEHWKEVNCTLSLGW